MNYSKNELIKYRLDRAFESIEEDKILAKEEKWNAVVNRLYYSCFYAVNALLIRDSFVSKTHSGTLNLFHLKYIKTNEFEDHFGEHYSMMFDIRLSGDYQDMVIFDRKTTEPMIADTEEFVNRIKSKLV
jgi:uncharacterized protein (UPF0332 family)